MFAVIILGVGFIMIAALFPVAIKQSKATADETSAAAIARGAANLMDQMATNTNMPYPGTDVVMAVPAWGQLPNPVGGISDTAKLSQLVRGNIISANDPRYAWVPFYYRPLNRSTGTPEQYAIITLICTEATNKPAFDQTDLVPTAPAVRANLQPRPVRVKIADGDPAKGDPDLIAFYDSGSPSSNIWRGARDAVSEGAFVIIRSDTSHNGQLNGRIYRVGSRRSELDGQQSFSYNSLTYDFKTPPASAGPSPPQFWTVWELTPGFDFTPKPTATPPIVNISAATEAWIVGRSFADNSQATPTFEGPAMDVSVYSTFVFCKP